MQVDQLPRFERPPLVETVLGVQFEPIPNLRIAHLGVFWKLLGADWPQAEEAPAVDPQFETFEEIQRWGLSGARFQLVSGILPLRLQIRNSGGDRMIQVQNGRVHLNWIRKGDAAYPHYQRVRGEFDTRLLEFRRFLKSESLGDLSPNQWEVTYINRMPRGTVWNEPDDWTQLFRAPIAGPHLSAQVTLESLAGEWHFEITPRRGRLHARLQHGRDTSEGNEEVLILTLTARGEVRADEGGRSLESGLDLGHETVVRSFHAMTSTAAHAHWGLIHDHDRE